MEKLDSIILAGGLGTRLREVVSNVPKPLVSVNNRPFLDILLAVLSKCRFIEKVIIAIGYKADKFIEKYKDTSGFNFEIFFSVEDELLGTGGAIKKALQYTKTNYVLVLNGDSYIGVDLNDLFENYKNTHADMTIVLKEVENANRYGRVKLNDDHRIISFEEKNPESTKGYINAGMYLIKKKIFNEVKENIKISLENELLPLFIKKKVYGYISYGKFIDIGIPETYEIADEFLKEVY